MNETKTPEFYTKTEAAKILRTSASTILNYVKNGYFRATKIGRRILFEKRSFAEDLARFEKYRYAPTVREKFPPTRQ